MSRGETPATLAFYTPSPHPSRATCIRRSRNDSGDGTQKERCAAPLSESHYLHSSPSELYRIMGRNSASEEILLRAKANGYIYRAHHEEDSRIDNNKYVAKTIKDQKSVLRRYEM